MLGKVSIMGSIAMASMLPVISLDYRARAPSIGLEEAAIMTSPLLVRVPRAVPYHTLHPYGYTYPL